MTEPHVCEDCGHDMRPRDMGRSATQPRVLSWACDHCGNIDVVSRAAQVMRQEVHAATERFSARAKVQRLPDGTIGVSLDRERAKKVGLQLGREVVLRGANGQFVEVVPTN